MTTTPDLTQLDLHEDSWHLLMLLDQAPGFAAISEALIELTDEGHPIVVTTADLKYSNGLVRFQEKHPERFLQFGISEQNMVSASAGLATTGLLPYTATFASFLALLCCEQIRTDVAYCNQPVRLIGHHSGISLGFYGTSHHATEDLAIMRSIANMTVIAPSDPAQFGAAIRATVNHPGPIYFRAGRGRDPVIYPDGVEFELGRGIWHARGNDLTLIATGSSVHPTLEAAEQLRRAGISVGVIDMHTIKPLDRDAVLEAARSGRIMTVEEHNVIGGLGGAVAEVLADAGTPARLYRHGMQDQYSLVGPPTHLYKHYELDADGIAHVAQRFLGA
jgi:transketolase